jgi:hypothetical protein
MGHNYHDDSRATEDRPHILPNPIHPNRIELLLSEMRSEEGSLEQPHNPPQARSL